VTIVFLDGKFLDEAEAKISIFDRGFLYGDGLFTTILVTEGTPQFLERHISRLTTHCQSYGLKAPTINPAWATELIATNHAHKGNWRLKLIVTGSDHVIMTLEPYTPKNGPVRCALYPEPFVHPLAQYKTLANIGRFRLLQYGLDHGFDDAISCTEGGILLEASFANLFWIEGKTFYTPSRKLPLYFGLTLELAIEKAQKKGLIIQEVEATVDEIGEDAALFCTNSLHGAIAVQQLGERPLVV